MFYYNKFSATPLTEFIIFMTPNYEIIPFKKYYTEWTDVFLSTSLDVIVSKMLTITENYWISPHNKKLSES